MEIFKLFGSIFVDTTDADKKLDKTNKKGKGIGETLGNGIKTVGKWGAAVVGAAATAGAAMVGMATKTAANCDEIDKMSQKLGLSREAYQEWNYILSQNGADINSLGAGMKTLTAQMDKVTEGNAATIGNFNKLGLSVYDSTGKLKSQEQMFEETVTALQGMEDGTEKARLATELFGKQGQELMPLLNGEAGSVEELKNKAHELGMVLDDETVDAGVSFTDTMDTLKRAGTGLFNTLGGVLMPIVEQLANYVIDNMPMIKSIFEQFTPILKKAAETILPPLMQLVQKLLPVIFQLLEQLMPVISEIIDAVLPIIIELLDMLLPPIMQIVEAILPILIQLISAILPLLSPIIELLKPIIELFMALLEPLLDLINMILPPIIDLFTTIIKVILPPLQAALGGVAKILSGAFKGAFDAIRPILQNVINIFQNIINFVKNVFTGNWKGAWENVKNIFSNIIKGLSNIFKAPINLIISGINTFIRGLNKIKIPDWVPGLGGKGFHINEIPKLKVGIDYVPEDDYPALLHKGERVLTKEENVEYMKNKSKNQNENGQENIQNNDNSSSLIVNIENFYNNRKQDIQALSEEMAFYARSQNKAKGATT